jgi:hypothetical protein
MSRRLMPQSVPAVELAELLRTIASLIEAGQCTGGHVQWMPIPPMEDPDDLEDLAHGDHLTHDRLLFRGIWRVGHEVVVVGNPVQPFGRPIQNTPPL